MPNINARLVGLELYFEDLTAAKRFYEGTLGLILSGEQSGHHAQFNAGAAFLCLEKKGVEDYPSHDKAVVFLEVPSVEAAINAIGEIEFSASSLLAKASAPPGPCCRIPRATVCCCLKPVVRPKLHESAFFRILSPGCRITCLTS